MLFLTNQKKYISMYSSFPKSSLGMNLFAKLRFAQNRVWEQENERYIEVADIEDKKEVYIVDTFPVRICENARKNRCQLTKGYNKKYLGYIASKKNMSMD